LDKTLCCIKTKSPLIRGARGVSTFKNLPLRVNTHLTSLIREDNPQTALKPNSPLIRGARGVSTFKNLPLRVNTHLTSLTREDNPQTALKQNPH